MFTKKCNFNQNEADLFLRTNEVINLSDLGICLEENAKQQRTILWFTMAEIKIHQKQGMYTTTLLMSLTGVLFKRDYEITQ